MIRKGISLLKATSFLRNQSLTGARSLSSVLFIQTKSNVKNNNTSTSKLFHRYLSSVKETIEFRAETRQLLDIVTNSIYTDKEVFLRELISNSSDALEKLRYKQVIGEVKTNDEPLGIEIVADKAAKTLTIIDNGIGMSKDELVNNLGVIARSGSKQFVESLKKGTTDGSTTKSSDPHGIIGQFGVGFYSAFMISDEVVVDSISAAAPEGSPVIAHRWSSDGSGVFSVEPVETPVEGHTRGSRLVLKLKEKHLEFADPATLKTIVKKYSSFVAFPIKLNGEVVNTVSALWIKDKKEVTQKQYGEFYKFITNAYDEPKYTLHYRTDAPIDLKVLFFVPSFHSEKFGGGQMEPGVNLYSRKVLIESKPTDLMPNWMRFVKGVVDSEDLPLSLSREKPQDSALLRRIKEVVTRKFIRFLEEQKTADADTFKEFYTEYSHFLKEGICTDEKFGSQIAKLLMFESSNLEANTLSTFDEYIARCPPEQDKIYFLVSTSRAAAMQSPYMETFRKHGNEVLLMYQGIDDFVMSNLRTFSGRRLTSIEDSSIDLAGSKKKDESKDELKDEKVSSKLTEMQGTEVCGWFRMVLGETRVREVKLTTRLADSPAIVTDHESGRLRKMMRMLEHSNNGMASFLPPQILEINPDHPVIVSLYQAIEATRGSTTEAPSTTDSASAAIPEAEIVPTEATKAVEHVEATAKLVAEQIFDNALIAAGLIDDPNRMLPRLNKILEAAMEKK